MISPEEKGRFLQDLLIRAPGLEREGERLVRKQGVV